MPSKTVWEWCCITNESGNIDHYETLDELCERELVVNLLDHEGCEILLRRMDDCGITDEWRMDELERIVKAHSGGESMRLHGFDRSVPKYMLQRFINLHWEEGERPELPVVPRRRFQDGRATSMRQQRKRIDYCKPSRMIAMGPRNNNVIIKNTSLWPNDVIELVVAWVFKECTRRGHPSKMTADSQFDVQHTNLGGSGHCINGRHVLVKHNRARPRTDWKYTGIKHAPENITGTALESLLHILMHEILHTTDAVKHEYRDSGSLKRQKFEVLTERRVAEIMSHFVDTNAAATIWKKYRKARRTQRNAEIRKRRAAAERKTPDAKMAQAEKNLARWQAELEKAKKHVKKWQTKVNRMRGARKAAFKRAATKNQRKET